MMKEIANRNIFVKNAEEIRDICAKKYVDIGVALDMYIANNKIERNEEIMKQYQEFRELCRKHALNDIAEMLR